jgi:hypothetical protein
LGRTTIRQIQLFIVVIGNRRKALKASTSGERGESAR